MKMSPPRRKRLTAALCAVLASSVSIHAAATDYTGQIVVPVGGIFALGPGDTLTFNTGSGGASGTPAVKVLSGGTFTSHGATVTHSPSGSDLNGVTFLIGEAGQPSSFASFTDTTVHGSEHYGTVMDIYGGSQVTTQNLNVTMIDAQHGFVAHGGSQLTMQGGGINITGSSTSFMSNWLCAFCAYDAGTTIKVSDLTANLHANTNFFHGASANKGAKVQLSNVQMTIDGGSSNGLEATGNGSQLIADNVTLTASSGPSWSAGAHAYSGGTVELNGGSITMQGGSSTGKPADAALRAEYSGTSDSTINASNVDIRLMGSHTVGASAEYSTLQDSANDVINIHGGSIQTNSGGTIGLAVSGYNFLNKKKMAQINATGLTVKIDGAQKLDYGTPMTYGAYIDGGKLHVEDSSIETSQDNVETLHVNGGSIVEIVNSKISNGGKGAAALYLDQGGPSVTISGGELTASNSGGWAIRSDSTAAVSFNQSAIVNGAIYAPKGGLTVNADDHVTINSDVDATNPSGDAVDTLLNDTSLMNLSNGSTWTGRSTNFQKVNLAGSAWNITGDSNVLSSLQLDATSSIAFGTPQNGTFKTLTVGNKFYYDGAFNGNNGTVTLNTVLNVGGALTAQQTDRVLVLGNVTGTTYLNVVNAGGAGASTDLNGDGKDEANEGISLVQVTGTAAPNSFQLANGYVAAGPYQYRLYAYAPGSSDASQRVVAGGTSNNFWDYRLQNGTYVPVVDHSKSFTDTTWNIDADTTVDGSLTLTRALALFAAPQGTAFKTLIVAPPSGSTGPAYISDSGSVTVNTVLNAGGALANQHTDRMLIQGDVQGTTVLNVQNAGGAGASTDLNGDGKDEPNEGISLVQVSGKAAANSFQLANGYVAAGPYQYRLYSYAPGSSDVDQRLVAGANDNSFWDYRLQNGTLTPSGGGSGGGATLRFVDTTWNISSDTTVSSNLALTRSLALFGNPTSGVFKTLIVAPPSGSTGTAYTSDSGSVTLNTKLDAGGTLANQHTDRLLVHGDVQGTTMLNVQNAGGAGASTDLNGDGKDEPNEGISLVQVSGKAAANSFQLTNGYVATGPYQYRLYAYAPGDSDATQRLVAGGNDNSFWDYRLQNGTLASTGGGGGTGGGGTGSGGTGGGSGGVTPPAGGCANQTRMCLVPQAPAYLVYSNALLNFDMQSIGELHQRLGEIGGLTAQNGANAEVFARAFGGNTRYRSNLSNTNFGYGYEQDASALQIGGNWLKLDGGVGSLRLGLAGTFGYLSTSPKAEDGVSQIKTHVRSAALTGAWQHPSGFYLDGIIASNWYRGSVTTSARGEVMDDLHSHGMSYSLEAGYPFQVSGPLSIEPQAQLTHQQLHNDTVTDADGVIVDMGSPSQTVGRIGARAVWTLTGEEAKPTALWAPYVKLNYLQSFGGGNQHVNLSDVLFSTGRYGKAWELGLGITATLRNNLSLYGDFSGRSYVGGSNTAGSRGWAANAGLKWTF